MKNNKRKKDYRIVAKSNYLGFTDREGNFITGQQVFSSVKNMNNRRKRTADSKGRCYFSEYDFYVQVGDIMDGFSKVSYEVFIELTGLDEEDVFESLEDYNMYRCSTDLNQKLSFNNQDDI